MISTSSYDKIFFNRKQLEYNFFCHFSDVPQRALPHSCAGLGVKDYSTCNRITVIPKITTNLLVTVETVISLHTLAQRLCVCFLDL